MIDIFYQQLYQALKNDITKSKLKGDEKLPSKRKLAKHLFDFLGMIVSPDHIIIGAGTEYLYSLISQLFDPKYHIALEYPSYNRITKV